MAEETKNEVVKKEDASTQVLKRIKELEEKQNLTFPEGYNPTNELKAFQLALADVKDKNGQSALQICTQASIANAMLNMTIQGLRVSTKQCYPIVYGQNLTLQRSYFGAEAQAKRVCPYLEQKPWHPVIVYVGDDFEFLADFENGGYKITKHIPSLEAIDSGNIKCVYLPVKDNNGKVIYTELMTWKQVETCWKQSKNTTNNTFQTNFKDQACIRTIIGRTAKRYLNTAEIKDGELAKAIAETRDEFDGSNNIIDIPSYTAEESAEREDLLGVIKEHGYDENAVKTYCKAPMIDVIPTEKLHEMAENVCKGEKK